MNVSMLIDYNEAAERRTLKAERFSSNLEAPDYIPNEPIASSSSVYRMPIIITCIGL